MNVPCLPRQLHLLDEKDDEENHWYHWHAVERELCLLFVARTSCGGRSTETVFSNVRRTRKIHCTFDSDTFLVYVSLAVCTSNVSPVEYVSRSWPLGLILFCHLKRWRLCSVQTEGLGRSTVERLECLRALIEPFYGSDHARRSRSSSDCRRSDPWNVWYFQHSSTKATDDRRQIEWHRYSSSTDSTNKDEIATAGAETSSVSTYHRHRNIDRRIEASRRSVCHHQTWHRASVWWKWKQCDP